MSGVSHPWRHINIIYGMHVPHILIATDCLGRKSKIQEKTFSKTNFLGMIKNMNNPNRYSFSFEKN